MAAGERASEQASEWVSETVQQLFLHIKFHIFTWEDKTFQWCHKIVKASHITANLKVF